MAETDEILRWGAALAAGGLAAGFLSGLFGVGGGILRVPLFLWLFPFFGWEGPMLMHLAAGTSLAIAIPSTLGPARAHAREGRLARPQLRIWIPAVVAGVVLGVSLQHLSPGPVVVLVFGVVMGLVGLEMIFLADKLRRTQPIGAGSVLGAVAFGVGALGSFVGVTGGAFSTPALTALGVPIHRAIALSAAGGVAISVVAAVGSILTGWGNPHLPPFSLGYVNLFVVAVMTPFVLVSARVGVRVAARLPERRLQIIFGVFLLFVSADMVRQYLAG